MTAQTLFDQEEDKGQLLAGLVAVGDADDETAAYIRAAVTRAADAGTLTAEGAVQVQSHRPRGGRPSQCMIHLGAGARDWAFPIGEGNHMLATDPKRWRWQESPDEPDVSGLFHGFGGRRMSAAAAGQHNAERARREMAQAAAAETLAATLSEQVHDCRLPDGSTCIQDARPKRKPGSYAGRYGTRHYVTPDGRYATIRTEYDWPDSVRISAAAVDRAVIAAGLGIDIDTIPEPTEPAGPKWEKPTACVAATAIVAGGLLLF